jgi:hypothetical protein
MITKEERNLIDGRALRKNAAEIALAYVEGRSEATVTGDEYISPRREEGG